MEEKDINRNFYELVKKVRRMQKSYFATLDRNFLDNELKPLESELVGRMEQETVTKPEAIRFRKVVWEMVMAQRSYFNSYSEESKKRAIRLERQIDNYILKVEDMLQEKQSPRLQFEET